MEKAIQILEKHLLENRRKYRMFQIHKYSGDPRCSTKSLFALKGEIKEIKNARNTLLFGKIRWWDGKKANELKTYMLMRYGKNFPQ